MRCDALILRRGLDGSRIRCSLRGGHLTFSDGRTVCCTHARMYFGFGRRYRRDVEFRPMDDEVSS